MINLRVSSLGSCRNKLLMQLRNYKKNINPDVLVRQELIFEFGRKAENMIIKHLENDGYEITNREMELEYTFMNNIKITGHIDGLIRNKELWGDEYLLLENKTHSPLSNKLYRNWIFQIQTYMFMLNKYGYNIKNAMVQGMNRDFRFDDALIIPYNPQFFLELAGKVLFPLQNALNNPQFNMFEESEENMFCDSCEYRDDCKYYLHKNNYFDKIDADLKNELEKMAQINLKTKEISKQIENINKKIYKFLGKAKNNYKNLFELEKEYIKKIKQNNNEIKKNIKTADILKNNVNNIELLLLERDELLKELEKVNNKAEIKKKMEENKIKKVKLENATIYYTNKTIHQLQNNIQDNI